MGEKGAELAEARGASEGSRPVVASPGAADRSAGVPGGLPPTRLQPQPLPRLSTSGPGRICKALSSPRPPRICRSGSSGHASPGCGMPLRPVQAAAVQAGLPLPPFWTHMASPSPAPPDSAPTALATEPAPSGPCTPGHQTGSLVPSLPRTMPIGSHGRGVGVLAPARPEADPRRLLHGQAKGDRNPSSRPV